MNFENKLYKKATHFVKVKFGYFKKWSKIKNKEIKVFYDAKKITKTLSRIGI